MSSAGVPSLRLDDLLLRLACSGPVVPVAGAALFSVSDLSTPRSVLNNDYPLGLFDEAHPNA